MATNCTLKFGSSWLAIISLLTIMQSFNKIQQLLNKTNGKVVGDLMTTVPLAVREATNLEDAVRYLPFVF